MCASPLGFFRAGPPPPKVVLLPDTLFFTRAVPITGAATGAEAASQIELALEAMSPFPIAQLYYGWFSRPGIDRAFVFAAYRRRFTAEQTASWEGAELVLPAFAAVLGADVQPSTTILLDSVEGLTAVHWETAGVPSKVFTVSHPPDPSDEQRATARDQLIQSVGGSKRVIDLQSPLSVEPAKNDGEVIFRQGEFTTRLPLARAGALDVRDKGELAALRSARKRDVLLWRVAVGCAAALLLLMVGELALLGGKARQELRKRLYDAQKPLVDKISGVHELTSRIEDLATKRLLPLEMVTQLVGADNERIPADIQFTRVHAAQKSGLYTVFVDGKTNNPAQVEVYKTALRNLPSVEKVDAPISQLRADQATFTLTVVFKPDALKPTGRSVAATP